MELIAYTRYEAQKIQHTYVDEFDVDHDDLDQNGLEEFEFVAGMLPVETNFSPQSISSGLNSFRKLFRSVPSNPRTPASSKTASKISSSRILPSAHRRELVWKSQGQEMASLKDIAHQFENFHTFSTQSALSRRHGRYTTKTAHRCPGYNRIEITLTADIARSTIVSHLTPTPHEICPVCKEIVQDAEIFACICGGDGKYFHEYISSSFYTYSFSRERISYYKMFDLLGMVSSPVRQYFRECGSEFCMSALHAPNCVRLEREWWCTGRLTGTTKTSRSCICKAEEGSPHWHELRLGPGPSVKVFPTRHDGGGPAFER